TVAEAFFGLWVATKVGAVLAQIGLIRAALVTGNTSLLAAMLRVGLPVAIGAVATGHGYQTPEEAAADPDRAQLQREGIERRGRVRGAVRRGWNAVKRVFGGGEAEAADGGAGIRTRARRGMTKLARGQNAQAIIGELRKAGYNDNAIAAVVGSMQTESGLNPAVPENSYNHGHHSLWQWDNRRWAQVRRWIESQGGNPNDAAWQTKAWVAEHTAKPGDPIYDNRNTERGGAILKGNPSLSDAVHGVRLSERFGPGEEGGRAALAQQWLPQLSGAPTQRDRDIATIQAATKNLRAGTPSARRPDVLADPNDARRQPVQPVAPAPSAWNGIPNAGLFVAQAQAAQAAQIANTTNDNRQSSVRTHTTHMHGDVIVNSSASNADGLIGDLKQSLKGRAYAMSSNTGQA
ncbi:phage tail tip lysozyme, partial [Methylobacterium sp. J-070]|uniref:phage tail tip lysozyme n=1 Tax=Methylobacterium sp. J-070 TaxID=2836650 RepID=UPI001FB8F13D